MNVPGWWGVIRTFFSGHKSALRDHVDFLKEQIKAKDEKIAELTERIGILERVDEELRERLKEFEKANEFIEFEGAAFKRKKEGGLHKMLYCPVHRVAATSTVSHEKYSCSLEGCRWKSHISPSTLDAAVIRATPGTLSNKLFG